MLTQRQKKQKKQVESRNRHTTLEVMVRKERGLLDHAFIYKIPLSSPPNALRYA